MFRRIEETVSMCLEGQHYKEFVLLSSDKFYFRNFNDYINFYEVALSVLDKANISQEVNNPRLKVVGL